MKARLVVLVLLLLGPAFFLLFRGNIRRQNAEKAHAQERAVAAVKLTAESVSHYLRHAHQQLATITQFPFALQQDLALTERGLRSLKRLLPDFDEFGLIETNGSVFAHVLESNVTQVVTQSLVRKVIDTREFQIAFLNREPLSNKPSLQFGHPVFATNGALVRVMYASLKASLLSNVLTKISLPARGVVAILDREGNLLARHPDPESFVGKNLPAHPAFQKALRSNEGVVMDIGLDGLQRLYAFSAVTDENKPFLIVTAGIPRSEVFGRADREFVADSVLLLLIVAFLLAAAAWYSGRAFVRPATAVVTAADRIAEGDLQARANLPEGKTELHHLAKRFDQMAASLERRQRELEQANAKIRSHNAELEKRVTERTSELEAINSELEAFSYSVSHDLRAPLRHMNGFANLILKNTKIQDDPRIQRQVRIIVDAASKMGTLIDDLLAFSRLGRQPLKKSEISFTQIVRELVAEISAHDPQRTIQWNIDPLPNVRGDAALLRQVWTNLISNAVKYTRDRNPAIISITARDIGNEWQFSVQDNGAGFNMAYADKLFCVFQRLHRDEEFEGTGVGLANVRRIIARHGGRTWAEGKLGQGATFFFSLPHL